MKTSVILLVLAGVVIAGAVVYLNHKPAAAPAPAVAAAPPQSAPPAPETSPAPEPMRPITPVAVTPPPAPAPAVVPAVAEAPANDSTNAIRKTVDALLAARKGKQAMFDQLRKDHQLEPVIADLQQRAAANPNDPEIPTTLGEAQLALVRQLHEAGGDQDEVGILAMQADQSFNAALKIDPQNWEAQYVKASTMYYWPPNEVRDGQAAQMLANLIDQQDSMPTQPEFALTYVALGNQYQKMGKQAEAIATWQLGAQKFPGDPALQKKINGQ